MNNILGGILGEVLKNVLNGNVPAQQQSQLPDIFGQILKNTDLGSIGGLLKQLQEGGLQKQVDSWLGNGQNAPVSENQLKDALGNEQLRQIAKQMGIPVDEVLDKLSKYLPEAVNQASPDGELAPKHAAEGRSGR
jgi:uncharacterized protein YidB (DUF937 family)